MSEKQKVHSNVKDEKLIQLRRDQIVKGAISLIKEKGFHRTTTREIAKLAGFSIGTLYEYIRTKDDILYLVCDRIYDEVQEKIQKVLDLHQVTTETMKLGIAAYFRIMDEMQDEVLVLYQEAKSLSKDALPYVLKKEIQMVSLFEQLIKDYTENLGLPLHENQIKLLAHNLFVQGQMWGFRRWALRKEYSLKKYTELQTEFFIQTIQSYALTNKNN
ncbi:TetR/AcrR family transcriptional regulator [Pallidibacillus pasinlerensis]|uniref:TetR/AcrR family transcriptional regulator n=1 Tax=Pallidibacillus pasinlerensis TaxID=2703818 RepID=A0ABX0A0F3_9BACI|nr:TetR/AcrR family transcriptional regulator [Pallidibacillus pasinlerensis]NCU16322.1 TetR/AcrR family transcriptional regulator [Pallidibacillus pasinlerensis]